MTTGTIANEITTDSSVVIQRWNAWRLYWRWIDVCHGEPISGSRCRLVIGLRDRRRRRDLGTRSATMNDIKFIPDRTSSTTSAAGAFSRLKALATRPAYDSSATWERFTENWNAAT